MRIAEYTKNVLLKKIKNQLAKEEKFAIIVDQNSKDLAVYQKYLGENLPKYSKNIVTGNNKINHYYIFSNFKGEIGSINQLRSLISN